MTEEEKEAAMMQAIMNGEQPPDMSPVKKKHTVANEEELMQ